MLGHIRRTAARLVLALVSAGAAYWVLAPYLFESRAAESIELRTIGGLPRRGPTTPSIERENGDLRPAHPRLLIKEAVRLFPIEHRNRYDPFSGFAYKPSLEQKRVWAEHPDGGYSIRTNSLGLREDEEVLEDPVDLRVLVAGDSHVDGVCAQVESFPNRAEAQLRERHPDQRIDVLNTGRGGYSFYNYEGVLERFLEQGPQPDVFVVTVYGGNDFVGQFPVLYTLQDKPLPQHGGKRVEERKAAIALSRVAFAQAFNSLEFFENHDGFESMARAAAIESLLRIHVRCRIADVDLIVVYLPSIAEVDRDFPSLRYAELSALFGLEGDDLQSTTRMADELLEALRARGIETLDLRPTFRAEHSDARPLYWREDLHLSLAGHETIARTLEPLLAACLESRSSR